jgi:hypothetical protein
MDWVDAIVRLVTQGGAAAVMLLIWLSGRRGEWTWERHLTQARADYERAEKEKREWEARALRYLSLAERAAGREAERMEARKGAV